MTEVEHTDECLHAGWPTMPCTCGVLVSDSLVVSQENLHCVDKSTVPDSLQNESQKLEMQGNPLGAVITKPYHLPECPQFCDGKPPKCRGGDCTLCDEVDCYCERLRACEQRVEAEWIEHCNRVEDRARLAALDAAEAVAKKYDAAFTAEAIRSLKEKP